MSNAFRRGVLLAVLVVLSEVPPVCADPSLVFNEIMYHPSTNEAALEWVELYNQLAVDLDVSGWSLDGGIHYTFPSNTIVHGGSFLVVASSPDTLSGATGLTNVLGPFSGRLSNSGETLQLINNSGRVVDEVSYGVDEEWPVAPDGSGVSLAKRDHDTASGPAANWAASSQVGGTPAGENFPGLVMAGLAFNEIASATDADFWLELMNFGTNSLALDAYVLELRGSTSAEYVIPAGTSLEPGACLALTSSTLDFRPAAGDKLFLYAPDKETVLDGVVVEKMLRGRWPDGTGPWFYPNAPTPGASNRFTFHREVVINEIMYHHRDIPPANGAPAQKSPESWIELYNHGTNAVDLTGWSLGGGITFQFPSGQSLAPGEYLVVAKDAVDLRSLYPGITILGDFGKTLSGSSDTVMLIDAAGNPANQVRYFNDGRWPVYADGGGSSLELRDPNADNSNPGAWAASDETAKSSWQTYRYRAVAKTVVGPELWNDFVLGLLGEGECLIDDITVVQSPDTSPVQLIGNGDFENGLSGWRVVGDHRHSRVEVDPANSTNHVLHIVANGPQEHMHNHIETTLLNGQRVSNGLTYEVSFRAKWLAGNNLFNTRLYFDRVAKTTALPVPALNGTPGARNSCFTTNIGPTFSALQHRAVVPLPGDPVTVSVVAQDPQGVSACEVWWSANGSAFSHAPMSPQANDVYTGTIPGYPAGTIVQFYVRATDGWGASATYPAAGPDSGALYAVADGQANLALGHNVRVILTPANRSLLHALTNVMSNENLPCTVIYDEQRAYYDMGVRLKGSERGRYSDTRVSFHLEFQPDDLFRGVHPVMLIDRSGAGDSTANKQEEIVIRHMLLHAGNIPGTQPDMCRVIAPFSIHTGPSILAPRHEDKFIETAYVNGGSGIEWEFELIYYPLTANSFGYKLPQPDDVTGPDISDLGNDQEIYRYNFIIKNHRGDDDYSRLIALAKSFSLPSGPALEAATEQIMDVDEWLRAFALISLCGVGDSYTFGNNHNLLLYLRPSDQRILAFPWDMDFTFTQPADAALIGDQNWGRIENLPGNKRRLCAHALDIISSTYNVNYMTYWVAHYARFAPGQNYSGALSYIQQRTAAVKREISAAGGNAAFAVNSPGTITTNANLVALTGTAPVSVQSIQVNGVEYPVTWTSVSGWTLLLPIGMGTNVLSVVGYDLHGNPQAGASNTVTVVYPGTIPDPAGTIVINEIMSNPVVPGATYVELFNRSATASFDLSHWQVQGLEYTFPVGSYIASQQYLVLAKDPAVFAATYGSGLRAYDMFPGQLQAEGQTLALISPDTNTVSRGIVAKVHYESTAPWPATSPGVSLQLVDAVQDNWRVGNWAACSTNPPAPTWVYVTVTGTVSSYVFYIYLQSAGDVYVDDIQLVAGPLPGIGDNLLADGDFESGFPGPWTVSSNLAGSGLSTAITHGGNASLHLVASSGGSTRSSAIWQIMATTLTNGRPVALSFWYLPSTNGGPLTLRLSNSGVVATVDPAPTYSTATPDATNNVAASLMPFPPLWINELQAGNLTGPANSTGQHAPWLELYNPSTSTVSLGGLYLANTFTNLAQWAFPTNASMNPGEFKVIFADGLTNLSSLAELHTGFVLASGAGDLALSRTGAGSQMQVLDYLTYTNLSPNHSYGSFPDGQSSARQDFYYATPGGTNNSSTPSVPTAPRLHSPVLSGDILRLAFDSTPGYSYQVQFKDDLTEPAWTPLGLPMPGSGALLEVEVSLAGQSQRFYRVQVVP